ncbi:MAG: hypothetical protein FWG72_01660 [Oscillospiraceae bacterium]|nr:hypothetical protein [Oscillospiraceae bacterium]
MDVVTNEETKLVEVWLSRAESSSGLIRDWLKACFPSCKRQGYRVVVFESGQRDLFAATRDLLLENRMWPASRKPHNSAR